MSGTSFKSAREAAAHALQLTKSLARTDEPPTDRELDELYRATGEACRMADATGVAGPGGAPAHARDDSGVRQMDGAKAGSDDAEAGSQGGPHGGGGGRGATPRPPVMMQTHVRY